MHSTFEWWTIVQRRGLLPSRWSPIHQTYLPLFSIAPFQTKGKEGNEDDGLMITDTQDPSFLLWISKAASRHNCPSKLGKFCSRFAFAFTANSLNRIVCGFKPPNRRNKAKTILFFHSFDRKRTVIKPRQNPVSSYIQLSSLAMFSLQSVKMLC